MSALPQKITRRKLSHAVVDRLLEAIQTGALAPGQQLPSERDLMEQYGVGRPAIREALQTLENMGLIDITHGERATVNTVDPRAMFEQVGRTARHILLTSPKTLDHLKQARLLFEVGMVRLAAERASEGDIEMLRRCIDDLERNAQVQEAFVDADIRFHITIAAISDNPICVAVSEAMLRWLVEFKRDLVRVPGREKVTIGEHQKILKYIAAHDPNGAAEAMKAHLERASDLYRTPIVEDGKASRH